MARDDLPPGHLRQGDSSDRKASRASRSAKRRFSDRPVGRQCRYPSTGGGPNSKPDSKSTPSVDPCAPRAETRNRLQWGSPYDAKWYNVSWQRDLRVRGSSRRSWWTGGTMTCAGSCCRLLLGTVDRSPIVRGTPYGSPLRHRHLDQSPSELIIQTKLHLISGLLRYHPRRSTRSPDRRALPTPGDVRRLRSVGSDHPASGGARCDRSSTAGTFQFPPPCIDVLNSGFAARGRPAGAALRGVTTAGRSPAKVHAQAVCVSLPQGAASRAPSRDPKQLDTYWTLLELQLSPRTGGALRADGMDSDIHAPVAFRQPCELVRTTSGPRRVDEPRRSVRPVLDKLEIAMWCARGLRRRAREQHDQRPAWNVLTAHSGYDGRERQRASGYIRSTSRVGRTGGAGPRGDGRGTTRGHDRSHFETFRTWHQTLYREVRAIA